MPQLTDGHNVSGPPAVESQERQEDFSPRRFGQLRWLLLHCLYSIGEREAQSPTSGVDGTDRTARAAPKNPLWCPAPVFLTELGSLGARLEICGADEVPVVCVHCTPCKRRVVLQAGEHGHRKHRVDQGLLLLGHAWRQHSAAGLPRRAAPFPPGRKLTAACHCDNLQRGHK